MEDSNYIVNGFKYETKDEFYKAQKEAETIEFIRAKTNFNNIKIVAKLYSNLIQKQSFHTLVGYCFLQELRKILVDANVVPENKIPLIPMDQLEAGKNASSSTEMAKDRLKQEKDKMEEAYKSSELRVKRHRIINIALVAIIIIIFAITLVSDYSPFVNVEERIINNYASWQQDLTDMEENLNNKSDELDQREREIEAKEAELGISN